MPKLCDVLCIYLERRGLIFFGYLLTYLALFLHLFLNFSIMYSVTKCFVLSDEFENNLSEKETSVKIPRTWGIFPENGNKTSLVS